MAKLFVITGPSGVGKGTLIEKLLANCPDVVLSVSATTRRAREGEVDGRDYFFVDQAIFDSWVDQQCFLEYATYIGNSYGTPRVKVEELLEAGKSVVLEIELQGAGQIRHTMPEAVQIFIEPPNMEVLLQRLRDRDTDSEEQIEARLATAAKELNQARQFGFDKVILNDSLDRAAAELTEYVGTAIH